MVVKFEYCMGGPIIEYSVIDDNTLRINGEDYWFDPNFVEYDDIPSPVPKVIYIAYDIYRDADGMLHMTCFQGGED